MRDPLELRSLARKCRMMTDTSLTPSVNKQLWLWAAELAEMADEVERNSEKGPVDEFAPTDEFGPTDELVVLKHWRER